MLSSNKKQPSTTTILSPKILTKINSIPKDPFEETIYDLLPIKLPLPAKQKIYKSIHSDQVRKEEKAVKKGLGSIGPAKVSVAPPTEFTRKKEGEMKIKLVVPHDRAAIPRKSAVPKSKGIILAPLKKDYIHDNKVSSSNTVPLRVEKAPTAYVQKKDYGKTPEYLQKKILQEIEFQKTDAHEKLEKKERDALLKRGIIPLPETERLRLLQGLLENWEGLNRDYQKLSLVIDTLPKINRKVNLERKLKTVEDQMVKLSHPNIVVNFQSAFA